MSFVGMGKIENYFKIVFSICLIFFLINSIGCSKGGRLISSPISLSSESNQQADDSSPSTDLDKKSDSDSDEVPGGLDKQGEHSYEFSITQNVHEQKEVDILLTVDNSYSMYENHLSLGYRFGDLFSNDLQSVDWQMAFISSCFGVKGRISRPSIFYNLRNAEGDMDGHHILSSESTNPGEIFLNTISSQQGGSCSQSEFGGIFNMINSPETHPEGFFREDALLAVVIVTDDKDSTDITTSNIITSVKTAFGEFKLFTVYGLTVTPDLGECIDQGEPNVNYKVEDLIQKTGGIPGNICAEDYSPIMEKIGSHIEKTLEYKEVKLRHENVLESTIEVTFSQDSKDWEFESETNKIIFDTAPTENTVVTISYRYLSSE